MEPTEDDSNANDPSDSERYGTFTTGGGDVVVYDTDNPAAWLQSDYAVEVGGGADRQRA
ncbi:DUF7331 family protein [Haloarcula litorea]|uniref:DUF7331 family protein n=1 Tax=Haloarcula litorea TaxID=3032579 RepID=UPI0023E84BC9|nr:hypothetical protein [Halomicroarcula sp. GDY20]